MTVIVLIVFVVLWLKYSFWSAVGIVLAGVAGLALLIYLIGLADTTPEKSKSGRGKPKDRGFDVNAQLRITYQDRNDERTTREIVAKKYLDQSPGEIYAYCKLRRAHRTFMTNRIEEAIDLETGEVINRLPTYFRSRRIESTAP
jgi:hypothetical protein